MPRQVKHRSFWTPLLFFVLLIAGVVIGFFLNKYIGSKRPITTVVERNDRLEELIDLINDRYVDSVNTDSLYQGAITGILKNLDPHTTYIPANEAAAANAGLNGKFQGIGVELFKIKDTLMVSKVISNSPAQIAGFRLGDRLLAIDTTNIIGKQYNLEKLRSLLSQEKNDSVNFTVIHAGMRASQKLILKKGVVPLYSVSASYMVDKVTGYIKIDRFSAFTSREFNKTLKTLKSRGMKSLILDLRNNPGGYVDAATAVANEFLGSNRLIVYTMGRTVSRQNYYADEKGLFEKGRLVVLVNAGTASAAEIFTGAIQDWDRGVIIGTRTFGKGLVQQQYELGDGSELRLTIARYYTPSGRSIQRPYNMGREAYEQSFLNRLYHPGLARTSSIDSFRNAKKYYSMVHHRVLKGGGGILPDIILAKDYPYSEQEMLQITSGNWMDEVTFSYYVRHFTAMKKFASATGLISGFDVPQEVMDHLKMRMDALYPQAAFDLWQNPFALDFIKEQLKAKMIQLIFGNDDYQYFLNLTDPDFLRAKSIINQPVYLKIIGGEAA